MAYVSEAPAAARKLLLPSGAANTRTLGDAGLGFDLDGAGHLLSPLWELIKAKAAELEAFLAGLLTALAKKADQLFPPETRSETLAQWLRFGVTVVLPALVLLCFLRCCWRCYCARGRGGRTMAAPGRRGARMLRGAFEYCARGRGGRTMAAPGRRGARMLRGAFEANPRGYFRDLRANEPLVY